MKSGNNEVYSTSFIRDLKQYPKGSRVKVNGVITRIFTKEKLISFTLDDSTATVECALLKSGLVPSEFKIGMLLIVLGEVSEHYYHHEWHFQLKINRYSIVSDVNEELYYTLLKITKAKTEGTALTDKKKGWEIRNQNEESLKKEISSKKNDLSTLFRVPLPKNVLNLKLRSAILKVLSKFVVDRSSQMVSEITFKDIASHPDLSELLKDEKDANVYLEDCIRDLAMVGILLPIYDNTQLENFRYEINTTRVKQLEDTVLDVIKQSSDGCRFDDIYKWANLKFDGDKFIISKEYLWEILDTLFKNNFIYEGEKNVFHYFQRFIYSTPEK